jgi:hypothetical protein
MSGDQSQSFKLPESFIDRHVPKLAGNTSAEIKATAERVLMLKNDQERFDALIVALAAAEVAGETTGQLQGIALLNRMIQGGEITEELKVSTDAAVKAAQQACADAKALVAKATAKEDAYSVGYSQAVADNEALERSKAEQRPANVMTIEQWKAAAAELLKPMLDRLNDVEKVADQGRQMLRAQVATELLAPYVQGELYQGDGTNYMGDLKLAAALSWADALINRVAITAPAPSPVERMLRRLVNAVLELEGTEALKREALWTAQRDSRSLLETIDQHRARSAPNQESKG